MISVVLFVAVIFLSSMLLKSLTFFPLCFQEFLLFSLCFSLFSSPPHWPPCRVCAPQVCGRTPSTASCWWPARLWDVDPARRRQDAPCRPPLQVEHAKYTRPSPGPLVWSSGSLARPLIWQDVVVLLSCALLIVKLWKKMCSQGRGTDFYILNIFCKEFTCKEEFLLLLLLLFSHSFIFNPFFSFICASTQILSRPAFVALLLASLETYYTSPPPPLTFYHSFQSEQFWYFFIYTHRFTSNRLIYVYFYLRKKLLLSSFLTVHYFEFMFEALFQMMRAAGVGYFYFFLSVNRLTLI